MQTGIERFVPSVGGEADSEDNKTYPYRTTKQEVIEMGLKYLAGVGTDAICRVCIAHGGSCCEGCEFLRNGVGCQLRNTSCTGWLCGFFKFLFYEMGLIREWVAFWDQVPGRDFRFDYTPSRFHVELWLKTPSIRVVAEAFADDLLAHKDDSQPYWLIEFKETLDQHIDEILDFEDEMVTQTVEKKLAYMTRDFKRYHAAKATM
ncbi:hypothetical protein EDM56_04785 [Brevibacillus fluminis]|uniref:DNA mismatch repair protein n=1 Tax=Brevibacillus fluminis TaxID=511487 RepID=A0A3M8DTF1_9BACL|nr:hypothetical protein [Brevibacillus fluminis]RNB91362.1 hypothetical protein EDM56_04785 [Brevibacillus fluminis]